MKRIYIVHLLPLEYYPPITNLLDVLHKDARFKVEVYSTHNHKSRPIYANASIPISRSTYPAYVQHPVRKIWAYIQCVIRPFWRMLRFKPDAILYYEPHSAAPVYLYKKYINKEISVFIHNHEYYSPQEFQEESMKAIRLFHRLETSFLYRKAVWISQTNEQRLELFKKDYPFVDYSILHKLANYPPQSWHRLPANHPGKDKIRLLYVGALSFENTYIEAIIDFVIRYQDRCSLDIYTYNASPEVEGFLAKQDKHLINYHANGIGYNEIPTIGPTYDIGLVLYKGHNLNYIFNAPNKLFEYLACGLNVWVPDQLEGCKPYLNDKSRPFVAKVNYDKLEDHLLSEYAKHLELPIREIPYFCENELQSLIGNLEQD